MKLAVKAIMVGEIMEKEVKEGEFIEHWGPLYSPQIKAIEGLEMTRNYNEADLVLIWNTIPAQMRKPNTDQPQNPEKIIMIIQETPVAPHRRMLHEQIDRFYKVVTHNPLGDNQIAFSSNPSHYPWGPELSLDIKREDTTIKNRNFFFAARRVKAYEDIPDKWDTHVLYGDRVKLVRAFHEKHKDRLKLYGMGWDDIGKDYATNGISTKTLYMNRKGNWRRDKIQDVEDSQAEFHIVLENCIQKNVITDHFHDGFGSDRVVFYLGCPNIEDYVPMDIFIDLRPYYNKETGEFDVDKIVEIADKMTQEEYDGYIQRARAWRKTLVDDKGLLMHNYRAHELTDKLCEIFKDYIKKEKEVKK